MKNCLYCDGLGYVNKDGSPLAPPVEEEYEAIRCPKCKGEGWHGWVKGGADTQP